MGIQTALREIADRDIAILRVSGEMDFEVRMDFHKALQALLASPRQKLVVDLTHITRLSSVFLGTLIDYGNRAQQIGKTLSVVATAKVAGVCQSAGVDKAVQIVVSKEP